MKRLQKRDPYLIPQHCDEHSVTYKSTGVVHNTNPKSIGALHLACQQICNPVKGTFTATVQHQSSLGWSVSSKDLPYAQQAAVRLSACETTVTDCRIRKIIWASLPSTPSVSSKSSASDSHQQRQTVSRTVMPTKRTAEPQRVLVSFASDQM